AESHRVLVAGEAEVARLPQGAGMRLAVERVLEGLANVPVQNLEAVEPDNDVVAVDGGLLVVPLANGPQVATYGRNQAVNAAVDLIVVKVGVVLGGVVEHLQLDRAEGGICLRVRRTDGK